MRRLTTSLLAALAAAVSLAQTSSQVVPPEVRRVGTKLACLCRTCTNTVGECPMLECHYAKPARDKIATMLAAGKSDQDVINAMVAENGRQALAVPPAEGFHLLAWTMPYIVAGLGLLAIILVIRRLRRSAPAQLPDIDPAVLERIEKDLAKLD